MRLMDLLERDNGLPQGTEELVEEKALSPEEEARILVRTLEKAGIAPGKKGEKTVKKSRLGLVLLAAALCIGTVAASAAVYFQMNQDLAKTLGAESKKNQELLKESGSDIQVSQDCQGWTLTVNQAVGDRNCAYILLDLTAPEGTVLDADLYQIDCLMAFENSRGGSYGWGQMADGDKTDNRVSFLIHTTMEGDLRRSVGVLKATGLKAVTFLGDGAEDDLVEQTADLAWAVKFPMEYQDDPITYRPGQTVSVKKGAIEGRIKVEKVEITPLSVLVKLSSSDGILGRVEALTEGTPRAGAILVEVRDKAGNTILPHSTGATPRGNTQEVVLAFQPMIDPDEIASIVLDGVEIPLEAA